MLALQAEMRWEQAHEVDIEKERYKMMLIAAHPENQDAIMKAFKNENEIEDLAPEPIEGSEAESIVDQMRELGIAVENV